MRIIQANAISLNGIIARENGEEDWLPQEGWDEFVDDVKKFNNFIMGRETYELVTRLYPDYNFDDVECDTKIIVSRQAGINCPKGYLLATDPKDAIKILEKHKIGTGLLIGGGKINSSFYAEKLVNEAWLTVNPTIIGKGRPFYSVQDIDVDLQLMSIEELSKGRVLLKYKVLSDKK